MLLHYFDPLGTRHLVFHASCVFRFKGAKLTAVVSNLPSVTNKQTNKDSYVFIDSQCTGDAFRPITDTSPHATLRRQSTGEGKETGHEGDWRGGEGTPLLTTNKTHWLATAVVNLFVFGFQNYETGCYFENEV